MSELMKREEETQIEVLPSFDFLFEQENARGSHQAASKTASAGTHH